MTRLSFSAIFYTLAAFAIAAPATRPIELQVQQLATDLASDDWKVREQAQAALVDIGPEGIPAMQNLARTSSVAEIRTRIEAAVAQIEESDKTAPSRVTLKYSDAQAQTVIQDIARQSRADIVAWPEWAWRNAGKVTIDLDRAPFWVAMQEICKQANLQPQRGGGREGAITLMQGQGFANRPSMVRGAFLVVAESISRSHSVAFDRPELVNSSFNIAFNILVDPKLRVLKADSRLRILEAVDENGMSLAGEEMRYDNTVSSSSPWFWYLNTPLKWDRKLGNRIATFRAEARFLVQTRAEVVEIEKPLEKRDVEKVIGRTRFTLREVKDAGGENLQARVVIESTDAGQNPEGPLTDFNSLQQSLKLIDARGRTWGNAGGGGGGGNRLEYTFHFWKNHAGEDRPAGEPVKLIWTLPLETREVVVPIEFKNLLIPQG